MADFTIHVGSQNSSNIVHYLLPSEYIKNVTDNFDAVIDGWGHGMIFCFYIKSSVWYKEL